MPRNQQQKSMHKMWSNMATYAILGTILATTSHQAYGFSTPRSSTVTSATKSLVSNGVNSAWSSSTEPSNLEGGRCIINNDGGRRVNGVCLLATSDDESKVEEEEKEEEEPELETEASTTGLFIPGFSDKVVPPPEPEKPVAKVEEVSKKPASKSPTINISNPFKSTDTTPPPPPKSPTQTVAKTEPAQKKKKSIAKDLSEDVSESIIDLPELPKLSFPSFGGGGKKQPPTPPSQPPPGKALEDAIAASLGGALTGVAAGIYTDIATDFLFDTDLPPLVPPAALGVAFGAGAFVGASQSNFIGSIVKFVFGKPILGVRDNIRNKITQTVDDIKSTPTRIKDAAIKKVEDTVDDIKATPGKIKDAAVQKVDETVEEIKVRCVFRRPYVFELSCYSNIHLLL